MTKRIIGRKGLERNLRMPCVVLWPRGERKGYSHGLLCKDRNNNYLLKNWDGKFLPIKHCDKIGIPTAIKEGKIYGETREYLVIYSKP